jgi:hypothetical protein
MFLVGYLCFWLGTAGTVWNLHRSLTKVTNLQISFTNQKSKIMKNTLLIPELTTLLPEVSEVIKNYIPTGGIYCFGSRVERISHTSLFPTQEDAHTVMTQVYLLVLTEESKVNATGELSDLIAGLVPNCKATLLLHKITSLRQLTPQQKWFFNRVMKEGLLVWERPEFPPYLPLEETPVRQLAFSSSYWSQRVRIARTYLDSALQIEDSGTDCVQHSMLHVVVEQVCLGMIAVFLGYQPSHFSLGYLMDLCGLFTPLASELFPRQTKDDQLVFGMLATNFGTLRHAKTNFQGYMYTELLEKRCGLFVEQAEVLVGEELVRLEGGKPGG